jgi:hypothetical protein
MGPRPTSEVIENLRITLQKLEQNFDSSEDEPAVAELKRILLIRIADLEAAGAQEHGDAVASQTAGDLPLVVVAEADTAAEAIRTLQLDRLD